MTFPEAVRFLIGDLRTALNRQPPSVSRNAPSKPPEQPSGLALPDALALVENAERTLWRPEGAGALAYLRGRGLADATIKAAWLGWTAHVEARAKDGHPYSVRGIVIPWFEGDRLSLVKVRQPAGLKPKYIEVSKDRPTLYPGPRVIRPGEPLAIVEGELDALLLGQEIADLAAVVTLGSSSAPLTTGVRASVLRAWPRYVATDADPAGNKAAAGWKGRVRRVRAPGPFKDWTDAHQGGVNLRLFWWRILRPTAVSWEELAPLRWGPGTGRPEPGVIIDRPPDPDVLRAMREAVVNTLGEYDLEERRCIQEESLS
jgi:hypothetical protein